MSETVLILAGGTTPTSAVQNALPPAAMCIAADSGIDHARRLGLQPDVLIGDLDSASAEGLAWAAEVGIEIQRHRAAKDETDLELALDHAVAFRPDRIVVAAIGGGRFDHLLANFALLANRRYATVAIDAMVDTALVSVIHDQRRLNGDVDELVSLLPINGDAVSVTTSGLRYPLDGEDLPAGSSRGVSNVLTRTEATVSLDHGTLLAIQPDRLTRPGTA